MARRRASVSVPRPRRPRSIRFGLPAAILRKISKTAQTRGADKDEYYQNRVNRNSTVLIPFRSWLDGAIVPAAGFENGYIVLVKPGDYFSAAPPAVRVGFPPALRLGENLLVVYETRADWNNFNPVDLGWVAADSRRPPLGGQYIARVPDTTRHGDEVIRHGYTDREAGGQGAGIRVYEYCSTADICATRLQLAYLAWRTEGVADLARQEGNLAPDASKALVDQHATAAGLADTARLQATRILNAAGQAVCPLCLSPISATDLASRLEQAEGRDVPDLTVTAANLFHVEELRVGLYNHRIYNLGWGHHHCNTVARDIGIEPTLQWMERVLHANGRI